MQELMEQISLYLSRDQSMKCDEPTVQWTASADKRRGCLIFDNRRWEKLFSGIPSVDGRLPGVGFRTALSMFLCKSTGYLTAYFSIGIPLLANLQLSLYISE